MVPKGDLNRREFLAPAAAAGIALTLVPRHVLGGPGYVAPSDKINLAYIGCGTQGTREMLQLLAVPQVQITSVCDPVKDGTNYIDWSATGIRDSVRRTLENPDWGAGVSGIRAGRTMAKEIIETYYAKKRGAEHFGAVASYADFRELLEKEKDIDAVKIMTPDHLHATIAIAAMKKHKHVLIHKPLSNRVAEVRMVVDTARKTGVATHLLAWHDAADGGAADDPGWRHRHHPRGAQLDGPAVLAAATGAAHGPAAGAEGLRLGPVAGAGAGAAVPPRATRTPCSAAGTISAAAASPTWAITACGRSSWRSICPYRTAWRRKPARAAKS